jgi:hypothetical protein
LQVKALKVSETQVTSSPSSNRNGAITRWRSRANESCDGGGGQHRRIRAL